MADDSEQAAGASEQPVLLERRCEGRVAIVTLNRPEAMNAISAQLAVRLGEVLEEIARMPRIRVVILTGAGPRAFSAGADLKERRGMTPEQWTAHHDLIERVFRDVRDFAKPIFAAVNGVAVGGGCELALSTDFIVAVEGARFGQPEVTRGFMPGAGATQLLPRRIPRGLALELLMTGGTIDAEQALRAGLVNRVVEPDELMAAAVELASTIASNSPAGVQQVKRAAKRGVDLPLDRGIEIELECYATLIHHPDRTEGVNAFAERRKPVFQDV